MKVFVLVREVNVVKGYNITMDDIVVLESLDEAKEKVISMPDNRDYAKWERIKSDEWMFHTGHYIYRILEREIIGA